MSYGMNKFSLPTNSMVMTSPYFRKFCESLEKLEETVIALFPNVDGTGYRTKGHDANTYNVMLALDKINNIQHIIDEVSKQTP